MAKAHIGTSSLFPLGRIVTTPNALGQLPHDDILGGLKRHAAGDWGDVDRCDYEANQRALNDGGRLFSVYHDHEGTKFWIITEADRSSTCVLMPEDY